VTAALVVFVTLVFWKESGGTAGSDWVREELRCPHDAAGVSVDCDELAGA
jgi:hypothetical protein